MGEKQRIMPYMQQSGVPLCDEGCPSHDGKRCRVMGWRPGRICEPAVEQMAKSALVREQPSPKPTDGKPVWELVIADMQDRDAEGRRKYGTPLQAHNGRDALVDAYQEALDLVVYLRQAIEERGGTDAS